jgi:hypothetical protein
VGVRKRGSNSGGPGDAIFYPLTSFRYFSQPGSRPDCWGRMEVSLASKTHSKAQFLFSLKHADKATQHCTQHCMNFTCDRSHRPTCRHRPAEAEALHLRATACPYSCRQLRGLDPSTVIATLGMFAMACPVDSNENCRIRQVGSNGRCSARTVPIEARSALRLATSAAIETLRVPLRVFRFRSPNTGLGLEAPACRFRQVQKSVLGGRVV